MGAMLTVWVYANRSKTSGRPQTRASWMTMTLTLAQRYLSRS